MSFGSGTAATRMAANILAIQLGQPRFTRGNAGLVEFKKPVDTYVASPRAPAGHDIEAQLTFWRS
jgi:hypothetical protein